jgi:hypothetical protein
MGKSNFRYVPGHGFSLALNFPTFLDRGVK